MEKTHTASSIVKPKLKRVLTPEEERARVSKNIARKAVRDAKKAGTSVASETSSYELLNPWRGMKSVAVYNPDASRMEAGATDLGFDFVRTVDPDLHRLFVEVGLDHLVPDNELAAVLELVCGPRL
jgi:hypothetical protein